MTRIAIIGGGISGLAAAYELEFARKRGAPIDWHLYEASSRFGGIIETTRHETLAGTYILESGPDGWVSEKPWARDLAIELGLESEMIYSNDATRKTYILKPSGTSDNLAGQLQPMPDRMRLMVPEDLATLERSPLFSAEARKAYADELANADELKATSPFANPAHDESVATFVLRHFGEEVLTKLAAPLLSGVFGGDVHKLSVRAVMPAFVAMERDYGSLIAGLQSKAKQRTHAPQPIFTSLRNGMGSLIDSLIAQLPPERLLASRAALSLKRERGLWCLRTSKGESGKSKRHFHHILLAAPLDTAHTLLQSLDLQTSALIPRQASSAILATFCWPAESAATFTLPQGFGFLVPHATPQNSEGHDFSRAETDHASRGASAPEVSLVSRAQAEHRPWDPAPQLLAATFVDHKFPHRAPIGAHIIRTFFGTDSTQRFANSTDEAVAAAALQQLRNILGPLPAPDAALTTVRRWPRSLPQYEVGHPDRMAQLDDLVARLGNLTLLGNSYRGVGLPDLIHAARTAARNIVANLTTHQKL